jgi:GT2 family glycosyltransferase
VGPSPAVTVLMPVHNGEPFLNGALGSILGQTYCDFEFVIIDDGSTDATPGILAEHQRRDRRIVMHRQDSQGLIAALNRGLSLARGAFIARMDSDDIALPTRLAEQVRFLSNHPDVAILGTAYWLIDQNGRHVDLKRFPTSDLHIRWANLLAPAFAHSTVMIRRDLLLKNALWYDPACEVEDYDLWRRVLRHGHGANLAKALLEYRDHAGSISNLRRPTRLKNSDLLALQTLQEELPDFPVSIELVTRMRRLFVGGGPDEGHQTEDHVSVGNAYLDMLDAWISRHRSETGAMRLRRKESARVAAVNLFRPSQKGWGRLYGRLLRGSPLVPLDLASHYSGALSKRFNLFLTMPIKRLLSRSRFSQAVN